MNHIIHLFKSPIEPVLVPYITKKKSQLFPVFGQSILHYILLIFISGIYDNFFGFVLGEYLLCEFLAERTGPAGDEYYLILHVLSTPLCLWAASSS